MVALPNLFIQDTLQLRARLMEAGGGEVRNAVIRYESDNAAVVSVTQGGRLLAVGVGTANVVARAIGYDNAPPAMQVAQVRGVLEIDSIRNLNALRAPGNAWFGDLLEISGVGLSPESLFVVQIGGVEAEIFEYVPVDPARRNGLGRLFVWAPPPATPKSQLFVLGFNGGLLFPDTINVIQRDLFEFNDTIPASLGPVPLGFRNPGLAFESRARTETEAAVDWYTFTNTQTADRTILVFSEMVGAETFITLLTDSIAWDGTTFDFAFGSSAWTIGRETYQCDGLQVRSAAAGGEPVAFAEIPFPFTLVALGDLPAGTYHIFIPYVPQGDAASYELLIFPAYASLAGLARDSEEENDYCDVAGNIPLGNVSLTIDNPHDIDWYRFTVPGGGQVFDVTATTDGTAEADLDLYLIADFRPDSLVLVNAETNAGPSESITQFLGPGDYFLVVFDFAGVPVGYTMNTTFTAPPAGAIPTPAVLSAADLQQLRAKREAAKTMATPGRALPEAIRSWRP